MEARLVLSLAAMCAALAGACSTPPAPSAPLTAPSALALTPPPAAPVAPSIVPAAGATVTATAAPIPEARPACPADMVDVVIACIDRYEAPNVEGQKPLLMQSLDDARAWCEGRGKRLCTEDEWIRACRGPEGRRYPYGNEYDEHACNHDKPFKSPRWGVLGKWPSDAAKAEVARLDQSEPSGARPRCVSAEGVHDLTGNVGEWVVKTRAHPEACLTAEQKQHRHVVQGCSWTKCFREPHEPACDYVNCAHADGFHSYEFGARCCKARDAEAPHK